MLDLKRSVLTWLVVLTRPMRRKLPQGDEGVRILGHRKYVGPRWNEIGRLQFDFLVQQGLEPQDYLCDIACGSLRGGVHFIPYLEKGHYLGIEKESELVRLGVQEELGQDVFEEKAPEFVISEKFEFDKFSTRANYALAQSLFTHLPPNLIRDCLSKLRLFLRDDGCLFATFAEASHRISNPTAPHAHDVYAYTKKEIVAFGEESGWMGEYIGDWGHPAGSTMVRYRPR